LTPYFVAGQFGAAHGVRGAVRLRSFLSDPESLYSYAQWFIPQAQLCAVFGLKQVELTRKMATTLVQGFDPDRDEQLQLFVITAPKQVSQGIVQLPLINDRTFAQRLTHLQLYLPVEQLQSLDDNEFYWRQLIGMTVIDKNDLILGKVVDLLETGANDVLVVVDETQRRLLIPYVPDRYVRSVNLEARKIYVDWSQYL